MPKQNVDVREKPKTPVSSHWNGAHTLSSHKETTHPCLNNIASVLFGVQATFSFGYFGHQSIIQVQTRVLLLGKDYFLKLTPICQPGLVHS
jgi:hypothetical protein